MPSKRSHNPPAYEHDYDMCEKTAMGTASTLEAGVIPIPANDAIPEEVQRYVSRMLSSKNGITVAEADEIAAKWKLGTGRDLRQYPAYLHVQILGDEAGWAVFKEVKIQSTLEKESKQDLFKGRFRPVIGIFLTTVITLMLLTLTPTRNYEALEGKFYLGLLSLCILFCLTV
ncbi:hypothetical protein HII31_07479 [Pseudocercospora fuligena]|uniref:Uncharacterized protein n=1 Tax=Pseudocercospora fuligena TaxID=685502 RepID=A0A8H6RHJ7_9PEZI|nr:hypothetical protein HII31_07479 [Pseudocercospora fuligena]